MNLKKQNSKGIFLFNIISLLYYPNILSTLIFITLNNNPVILNNDNYTLIVRILKDTNKE